MKKTLIMASLIAAVEVAAQGTLYPGNIGHGVNVPFDDCVTGRLGTTYQAQICLGPTWDSLAPVGNCIVFAGNGYFAGKTMTFDGTGGLPLYAPGATVYVRVDVFPVGYPDYSTAAAAVPWKVGQSNTFLVTLGNLSTPGPLAGLERVRICYIPEPSSLALIGLGVVVMLLRRRNCSTDHVHSSRPADQPAVLT